MRTAILVLEIHRDRFLAPVLREKRRPHQLCIERLVGAELACQVAGSRHFDLDDFRAELRKLVRAKGPRENVGEIEHANAGERSRRSYRRLRTIARCDLVGGRCRRPRCRGSPAAPNGGIDALNGE